MDELVRQGVRSTLLDVPGFGAPGALSCPATVAGLSTAVAAHLRRMAPGRRVVLFGHSTAAIVALRAAIAVQGTVPLAGLVLAAPVFAPPHRTLPALVVAATAACRREPPSELRVLRDHWRGRRHLPTLVRTGLAERPEELIRSLTVPVTLTAGAEDTLSPRWWLLQLAEQATRAADVEVAQLAGSHNNPFSHPGAVADLLAASG